MGAIARWAVVGLLVLVNVVLGASIVTSAAAEAPNGRCAYCLLTKDEVVHCCRICQTECNCTSATQCGGGET